MTDQEHADNVMEKAQALSTAMTRAAEAGLNVTLPEWIVQHALVQGEHRPVRYLLRELGVARNLIK